MLTNNCAISDMINNTIFILLIFANAVLEIFEESLEKVTETKKI